MLRTKFGRLSGRLSGHFSGRLSGHFSGRLSGSAVECFAILRGVLVGLMQNPL